MWLVNVATSRLCCICKAVKISLGFRFLLMSLMHTL